MWIDTVVEASIAREWIANVGQRNARERLAHLLCEFALRLQLAGLGQETGYELPMTQQELADATGMTAVHINRTIKSLEKDRLVDRTTPRAIMIRDWAQLADAGDFDSTYLHIRKDVAPLSAAAE
jgi:CRP-like cAMP-binding protein